MRKRLGIAWISKSALELMVVEAAARHPDETGGVLIGYQVPASDEVVVTAATGPGRGATHGTDYFIHDQEFEASEVARLYHESGRLHVYLGDWHSHPSDSAFPSPRDLKTLRSIASAPEARAAEPLMLIVGQADPWSITVWQRGRGRLPRRSHLRLLEWRLYDVE